MMRDFYRSKTPTQYNTNSFKKESNSYISKDKISPKELYCLAEGCITKINQNHQFFHEEIHRQNNSEPVFEVMLKSVDAHIIQ